jgi:hypothetical protein
VARQEVLHGETVGIRVARRRPGEVSNGDVV